MLRRIKENWIIVPIGLIILWYMGRHLSTSTTKVYTGPALEVAPHFLDSGALSGIQNNLSILQSRQRTTTNG